MMRLLSRLMSVPTALKEFRVGMYAPAHGVKEPRCAAAGVALSAPSMPTNAHAPAKTLVPRTIRYLRKGSEPPHIGNCGGLWRMMAGEQGALQSIRWVGCGLRRTGYSLPKCRINAGDWP